MSDYYENWAMRFALNQKGQPYAQYRDNTSNKEEVPYHIPVPEGWECKRSYPWVHYAPNNHILASQGWKIHTSTVPVEAHQHLKLIADFLFKKNIPFKHLASETALHMQSAKYASRGSSGKFITVYPQDDKEFIWLLDELEQRLKEFHGPYILSDVKYKQGPVYFRYGAFKMMKEVTESGNEIYVIYDPLGNYVEDKRGASFVLPDFVKVPDSIRNIVKRRLYPDREEIRKTFYPYKITGALHYSNSGGVYKAKSDNNEFVIKEAREYTAPSINDTLYATDRLSTEYNILSSLQAIPGIITPKDLLSIENNLYLVEEYFNGVTLQSWSASNFPFYGDSDDIKEYEQKALTILNSIRVILQSVHAKGIAITDLQLKNILVNDALEVKIIDLEFATKIDSISPVPPTPGFSPNFPCSALERDKFGLLVCALSLFSPPFTTFLTPRSIYARIDDIAEHFSTKVVDFIKDMCLDIPHDYLESTKDTNILDTNKISSLDLDYIINKLTLELHETASNFVNTGNYPGDIDSFITQGGTINVANGLTGVLLFMHRANPELDINNLLDYIEDNISLVNDFDGLLYGRAGIYAALCELGRIDNALKLFLQDDKESKTGLKDLSLGSGVAGTQISLLRLYEYTKNEVVYSLLEKYDDILSNSIISNSSRVHGRYNSYGIDAGLWSGWSGISLACSIRSLNTNIFWKKLAEKAFDKESSMLSKDSEGRFYISSKGISYPYLGQGSAGDAFVLTFLSENSDNRKKYLPGLLNACKSPFLTIYSGINSGYFGLLAVLASCSAYSDITLNALSSKAITAAKIYGSEISNTKNLNFLSEGGYYLSSDFMTGGSGVLGALLEIKYGCYSWFPLGRTPRSR